MNLKAFAGFAKWGAVAASVSLILVFGFSFLFALAANEEADAITAFSVATSRAGGVNTNVGDHISKNDTQELFNFSLTIEGNVSNITILVPGWAVSANYANISVSNASAVQFGTNLTGWAATYVTNFSATGDPLRIQLNTSDPSKMLGNDYTTTNRIWFALNGTPKIPGSSVGNFSDNHTMTWYVYASNASTTNNTATKITTIVDNKPPNIFNVIPLLNGSGNTYIQGLSNETFQVNVSEAELNVSARGTNDGATNVTLWYKKSSASAWNAKTLLCYNATAGYLPNGPTNTLYTCNTTIDLSAGGEGAYSEGHSAQFFFNASDLVLNAGFNGTQDSPHYALVDRTAPTSTNVATNVSYVNPSKAASLNAQFADNYELANATLAMNWTEDGETVFVNYTNNATFGSPSTMTGSSYVVNFTWSNSSVPSNRVIAWQVIAKDYAGNAHATALQTFTTDSNAPSTHGGFITPVNNANVTANTINITFNVSVNDTLSGVSFVYLNISREGERLGINNITLTQGITGYWNATMNSTFNLAGPIADGNYTVRIVANDTLNNVNGTSVIRIWIDTTAPAISITRPTADQVVTGQFTVEALVTDSVRVSNVQYRFSNASFTSGVFLQMLNSSDVLLNNSGVYNSTNVTNANLFIDGVWNVTIWANDSVNNIAQANVSITINNVQNATELDVSSYVNGSIRKAGQTITLNFTTIGNQFGLFPSGFGYNISVYLVNSSGTAIYAGNVSNSSQFWANGTITIPANTAANVIDDGNRTFVFKTFDNGGNLMYNGSSNFTVSIDNTAANYSNPSPANNSFIAGTSTQLFQVSMTEVNLNASKNVTLYWDFTSAFSTIKSRTLLCTGSDSGLYNLVGPNYICNTTLNLAGLGDGDSVYYFFNNSNRTQPNGDMANNGGTFGTQVIPLNTTVDRTNPAVGVLSPLGSANVSGSFTLNISVNNTPAGVASVSYRVTNDTFQSGAIALSRGIGTAFAGYWNGTNNTVLVGLEDGLYRININATDNAGNINSTVNVTITIDNTKPNVTVVTPTSLLNFSTTIAINATVRDSGISRAIAAGDILSVQYYLSNTTWTGSLLTMTNASAAGVAFWDMYNATNFTMSKLADGRYNLTINATDYAGNSNVTQYVTIGIDRNAPVVSIVSPTANQFIKGSFNITAEVNDAVWVKTVFYRLSNGTNSLDVLGTASLLMTNASGMNATGGGYYNATNVTSAVLFFDGVYNVTVAANDTVNNVAYANLTITIDNNVPGSSLGTLGNASDPAGGTNYSPGRLYKFNKTFNDSVGVTSVVLQVDFPSSSVNYTASRLDGDATLGNWSANITDLAANTTGYGLIWYASDATGNVLKTAGWNYTVTKNSSAFATLSVNQTTVQRGDYINITVRSTIRDEINMTLYTNYTGSLALLTSFVPHSSGNQNITFTGYLKGIWNISANTTVTDNYTANTTVQSVTVLVQDTQLPAMRIYGYTNGTRVKFGDTINLNISIADNYGIDSAFNVSVYFNGSTIGSWIFAGNISNSTFSSNATSAWANGTITIPSSASLLNGNATINVTILDNSNNLGMNDSFVVDIDTGAPLWSNNATSPGSDIGYFPGRTYKFNITLADQPFGVDYVFLEFNGTNYTASRVAGTVYSGNWTANITDLAANSTAIGYRFRWHTNDTLGQWNTTDLWNYTIYKNTSAIATLEVNTTVWERGTALNITAYSTISASINTTIYANITSTANQFINLTALAYKPYASGNQNITVSNSGMSLGKYNITANTTTNENYTANSSVAMITITLQDSVPWVQILSPANMSNVTGSILINVSAIDLSGVANVSYELYNETEGISASGLLNNTNNINSNHYNITISTTSLFEGRFKLNITSYDNIGNVNATYYFNITVDRTAPTAIINYQADGTRLTGLTPGNYSYRSGTIYVNATITDSVSGVNNAHQLFRIGNATHWMGPTAPLSTIAGAFNGTNVTTILADGLYNITVTVNDTVGNARTNVTFFYVDNTAPTAVIALSNSTSGYYRPNATEQIRIQINDASQTNATIDVRAWSNNTGWTIYKTTSAAPSVAAVYNVTIDTSDLVDNERVKFFVMATDNASNVATYPGSLGIPLSNITIDVNCGHVGRSLGWCSGSTLKTTANGWASADLPPKTAVEGFSSLQSNFTVDNATKRSGVWGKFNYTYYYTGSSWLSFDPNSAPTENTLKMFNNTGEQRYWFNINSTGVVFRIE